MSLTLGRMFGWWEFEGKETPSPKYLKWSKKGSLDRRYRVNKEFMADKRWVYVESNVSKMWKNLIVESITNNSIMLDKIMGDKK